MTDDGSRQVTDPARAPAPSAEITEIAEFAELGAAVGSPVTGAGMEAAGAFQCDLYRYWRVVANAGGFSLGRGHHLPRVALRRLRAELAPGGSSDEAIVDESADGRLYFTRRLLQRLGLLRVEGSGRLVTAERSTMARYLDLPFGERLRLCVRLWVAGAWWVDQRGGAREPARLMAPAPPAVAVARRRAQQMLSDLPVGAVLALPPPAPLAGGAGRRARSRQSDARGADARVDGSGERPANHALAARRVGAARLAMGPHLVGETTLGADTPDAELIYAALTGPLWWLGFMVPEPDGETSPPESPSQGRAGTGMPAGAATRWRTTAAVAALGADAGAAGLVEPAGRVVAQPNFEIVALPPLAAPILCALDTCAEPRGEDRAARYALTRQSFAAACQAGWAPDEVGDRLEAVLGGPLPQNVRATVGDWTRRAARLRMRPGLAVLETRDPAALDALLADVRSADWVERRVTPTVALLRAASVMAVRAWLLRRGIMPAVVASPPEAGGPRAAKS